MLQVVEVDFGFKKNFDKRCEDTKKNEMKKRRFSLKNDQMQKQIVCLAPHLLIKGHLYGRHLAYSQYKQKLINH
jgi:hypothetical protein